MPAITSRFRVLNGPNASDLKSLQTSTTPVSRTSRTRRYRFNYSASFGPDLLKAPSEKIGDTIGDLTKQKDDYSVIARPNDPEVRDYMSHVLGGQRALMDEYVQRASREGRSRAGMNVMGGPDLASSLHHDAMKSLASGYSDRFREAIDYNRTTKSTLYQQRRDRAKDLQNLFGIQLSYLSNRQDRQDRMGAFQREDWLRETDRVLSSRDESQKTDESQKLRPLAHSTQKQVVQESSPAVATTQGSAQSDASERTRAAADKRWLELQWRQLLRKMDTQPLHWTRGDQELFDALGIQLGYMTPWKRSFNVKIG
ncbi:hypothetical protein [Desulfomonile tiedjei]|uniref:Uncharacterized protein n=1 Tax=Desulfomonile tiedjei (strain ATCC 49306 / DSM 6799 / DCB-1) TaxID=706587 RepID=I4C8S9_DESTA|nr:hypothetical protein [Desulfomonile tiedjei]AFM25970.1 hypothetical protein Desti_3312 [Desulfomonile tiedjei DSM 6799]